MEATMKKRFKEKLKADGISRLEWCRKHKFVYSVVSQVLNGFLNTAEIIEAIKSYIGHREDNEHVR